MFIIWFLVKMSGRGSLVNLHPLYYYMYIQEGKIKSENMDVVNQRKYEPHPEIIVIPSTQGVSSVGIMEKMCTTKFNANFYQRIKR